MLGDLDAVEASDLREVLIRCGRALDFELVERSQATAGSRAARRCRRRRRAASG